MQNCTIEDQGKLIPIEIKASSTPTPQMAGGIATFNQAMRNGTEKGYVVYFR